MTCIHHDQCLASSDSGIGIDEQFQRWIGTGIKQQLLELELESELQLPELAHTDHDVALGTYAQKWILHMELVNDNEPSLNMAQPKYCGKSMASYWKAVNPTLYINYEII